MKETTPETLFENIDWPLLKKQKTDLLVIMDKIEHDQDYTRGEQDSLQGILHLIDAIQDCGVDYYGIDKQIIFNLTPDD